LSPLLSSLEGLLLLLSLSLSLSLLLLLYLSLLLSLLKGDLSLPAGGRLGGGKLKAPMEGAPAGANAGYWAVYERYCAAAGG